MNDRVCSCCGKVIKEGEEVSLVDSGGEMAEVWCQECNASYERAVEHDVTSEEK